MQFRPGVSLILGGARSGKSVFAEQLAAQSRCSKIYLATSQAWDGEMQQRIELHQSRRGDEWQLVEEPIEIADRLSNLSTGENCILVDCLTLWLTNLMMAERNISHEAENLVSCLTKLDEKCNVLFVSNEVGQGIVPVDKMARQFRDHAGRLHQQIAAVAHNVWFVTAGLPQKLK